VTGARSAPVTVTAGEADARGLVFDLDTFAIHDGPGIRMTVYFKGCPLSCAWCHSPESKGAEPEVVFVADRCVLCGECVVVCPEGAHELRGGQHVFRRESCRACGACAEACPKEALVLKGEVVCASEMVERAVRMKPFFSHSGGGVTLTGGEVTAQPAFAEALLRGCRAEGIHTAIETSGACSWAVLDRLLPHTDLVLYDIKLMDDAAHRRWVGASNQATLENAARLARARDAVHVRVPLIPGITDTEENLMAIFSFCRGVGLRDVALLPYNEAAGAKYEWLGLPYSLEGTRQSDEALARLATLGEGYGLRVEVEG